MRDVATVLKKELREWYNAQSARSWLWQALLTVGIFGILMPATAKSGELGFVVLLAAVAMPAVAPVTVISDAFAGERERGTLETLLATPLSDSALFVGKVLSRVLYAWVVSLAVFGSGVATLCLTGHSVPFSVGVIAPPLLAAPLIAFLIADVGAVISCRARSSRVAEQILGWGVLSLVAGSAALFFLLPPAWQGAILHRVEPVLFWAPGLLLADALCLWASLSTFRRAQLLRT